MTDTTTDTAITFDIDALLADAGYAIVESKPRMTLAPSVVKALTDGASKVFVFTQDGLTPDHAAFVTQIADAPGVTCFSEATRTYAEIKSHVSGKAKTLKLDWLTVTALAASDGSKIAAVFSKSSK